MSQAVGRVDVLSGAARVGVGLTPEQELIARARAGDPSAFNTLIRTHQHAAYGVAYRILGHPDSAADVVQDALLSAYRALPAFRGGSFRGWLLRIVVNACYDLMRTAAYRRQSYLEDTVAGSGQPQAVIDRSAGPERTLLRRETVQTIEAGIARLPRNQRLVLILSDLQGFSYGEIAQATGASLGAVKSRLHRARQSLREYLRRELETADDPRGLLR